MIDESDSDAFGLASLFSRGRWAVVLLVVAVVLWFIAMRNETACARRACPDGFVGKPLDHVCVCVGKASP